MTLQGVKVLVDGYNLEYSMGTGIKTYSLSLITALTALGANVDVLLSAPTKTSKEPLLNEILLFDVPRTRNRVAIIVGLVKAATIVSYRARNVSRPGVVITRGFRHQFLDDVGIAHLPHCYDVAHLLSKRVHMTTRITPPSKVDVWHATYPLPVRIRGAATITTIHDLVALRLPYLTLDDKTFFYRVVRDAVRDSSLILTVSQCSKDDIVRVLDADPEKVIVTYQPVAQAAPRWEDGMDPVLRKYSLRRHGYILFVAAIEPKKNIGRLIGAFAGLDCDMTLAIVGEKGWMWESELREAEAALGPAWSRKIRLLGYVPSTDLPYLYAGAFCLASPSLYEGFGLPPIEAMRYGCPVVASREGALPEICGEAAIYVDPYDTQDIRAKLESLLQDDRLRARLGEAGVERARFFDMEPYLTRLAEAYRRVL